MASSNRRFAAQSSAYCNPVGDLPVAIRKADIRFERSRTADLCPLLGVERTSRFALQMSAFDPKRTSLPHRKISANDPKRAFVVCRCNPIFNNWKLAAGYVCYFSKPRDPCRAWEELSLADLSRVANQLRPLAGENRPDPVKLSPKSAMGSATSIPARMDSSASRSFVYWNQDHGRSVPSASCSIAHSRIRSSSWRIMRGSWLVIS